MTKKPLVILTIFLLVTLLAACSSLQLPGTSNTTANAQGNQNDPANFAQEQFDSKLALGTLQLEDTANAVTPEQAATLLPLWKGMKSLNNSATASPDEINALYAQIKEGMTADQVSAIEAMQVNPEDMTTLAQKYGVEMPQVTQDDRPTVSADERATRIAQFQAQGGQNGQGFSRGQNGQGGGAFSGVVPPNGGFNRGFDGGQAGDSQSGSQSGAQRTPQPGNFRRAGGSGFNNLFIDPLIKLLEEKAAAS